MSIPRAGYEGMGVLRPSQPVDGLIVREDASLLKGEAISILAPTACRSPVIPLRRRGDHDVRPIRPFPRATAMATELQEVSSAPGALPAVGKRSDSLDGS